MILIQIQSKHVSKILVNLLTNEGTSKIMRAVSIMTFRKRKGKRKKKRERYRGREKKHS